MKASEIQIGDYIWLTDDIYVKVEQITKRKIGFHLEPKESKMQFARLCDIAPITLDDILMEKLGFKVMKYRYVESVVLRIGGCFVDFSSLSNTIGRDYYAEIRNERKNLIGGCDVQYLHQLQQLVRLATGKEMEVRL